MTQRRTLYNALRRIQAGLLATGCSVEAILFGRKTPSLPPLFILGLPRSGSTLIYQAVCQACSVAFPPKLARTFWMAPATSAWIAQRLRKQYSSDFESTYGRSKGPFSPTNLLLWNALLDKSRNLEAGDVDASTKQRVAEIVGRFERVAGRAYCERNHRFNQWLPLVADIFPQALFLVTVREERSVALSMLRARIEEFGGYESWFLAVPRSFPSSKTRRPKPKSPTRCAAFSSTCKRTSSGSALKGLPGWTMVFSATIPTAAWMHWWPGPASTDCR